MCVGMERREVEKRIDGRKEAAHGFRNLSIIRIPEGFEQGMSGMKTKFDIFVNTGEKSGEKACPVADRPFQSER